MAQDKRSLPWYSIVTACLKVRIESLLREAASSCKVVGELGTSIIDSWKGAGQVMFSIPGCQTD